MKIRRSSREVPPERQTMGVASLFGVLDKFGYSRGQYGSVVFSA
jgi:hypothetical protein